MFNHSNFSSSLNLLDLSNPCSPLNPLNPANPCSPLHPSKHNYYDSCDDNSVVFDNEIKSVSKKRKLTKKEKLKRYITSLVIASTIMTGSGIIADKTINHVWKKCPLDYVLGIEHQMKHINEKMGDDWVAILVPSGTVPEGYKVVDSDYGLAYNYYSGCVNRIFIENYDRVFVYSKDAYEVMGTLATPVNVFDYWELVDSNSEYDSFIRERKYR